MGTEGRDSAGAIALGTDLYVVLALGGAQPFFPATPAGAAGPYIARFDRSGVPLRLERFDNVSAIAVGSDGTPYIGMSTSAPGLATPGAFQTTPGSSTCVSVGPTSKPCADAFVAHYSADLTTKLWGTYVRETASQPNNANEEVRGLAVDATGAVTVVGLTLSASFPITAGAFETVCEPCNPSSIDGTTPFGVPFVTKLNASGSGLIFSTFLNGNTTALDPHGVPISDAIVSGVAVDPLANVFVSGSTWNPSFPAVGPQLPQQPPGSLNQNSADVFVAAFSPTGTGLYASRFGGGSFDLTGAPSASQYGTMAVGGIGAAIPLQNPVKSTGLAFLSILSIPRVYTALDVPAPNGLTRASSVTIRGWAVDTGAVSGTGINSILLDAVPVGGGAPIILGVLTPTVPRPDVALALGGSNFTNSGFSLTTPLQPGQYTIRAFAHSSISDTTGQSARALVTALAGTVAKIVSPSAGALPTQAFSLNGYAVDLDASTGTGVDAVHVWAYPVTGLPFFLGAATYGETRSALADMFGAQFTNGGFSLAVNNLAPGAYTIAAHAHSTVTGTFSAVDTVTITVPASATELHVDVPVGPSLYQGFTIGGWAIDPGAPGNGTGVDTIHVWAFPAAGGPGVPLGATTTFFPRADVGAARGTRFMYSGFNVKTSSGLAPGDYQVATYARSTLTQTFNAVDVRPLTVLAATPVFQLTDTPDGSRVKAFHVIHGYAFDPRAASGLGIDAVHVYVYPNWGSGAAPVFVGLANYGLSDSAVGARFGSQFTNAGMSSLVRFNLFGSGTHLVALFAHSSVDGSFTAVSRRVTVPVPQFLWSIDAPQPGAVVTSPVLIGGWAIDLADVDVTPDGSGIVAVAIYATPVGGGAPILVCHAEQLQSRTDVAQMFGTRFLNSGFSCAPSMAPGTYDLQTYFLSDRSQTLSPPAVVRITVQ
jgi:hypothetical protein